MLICKEEECTGCGLCQNICPTKAIVMKENNNFGHIRPFIDMNLCINCNICRVKCPNNNKIDNFDIKKVFAVWNNKKTFSSSGGMATSLYKFFLKKNYWIVGVKGNIKPKYILTQNYNEISFFQGSKYTQPDTLQIYTEVLSKLKKNENVFFIGLPCHCAAIKSLCKDYLNNLVIVDLICHGVPSRKSLFEYLNYLEKKYKTIVTDISYRDNKYGVAFSAKNKNGIFYKRTLHEDLFLHSFIEGDLFEDSCYQCKYANCNRITDITIGDFWGVGSEKPFSHKTNRVSAVIINSKKGEKIFQEIKKFLFFEERPISEVINGNKQLQTPSLIGKNRKYLIGNDNFINNLNNLYKSEVTKKYLKRIIKEYLIKSIKFLGGKNK